MKLCKTCNKIINNDVIAQSIYSIKQQCMECSSIQVKAVSLEEYEEMKQKELEKDKPGDSQDCYPDQNSLVAVTHAH